MDSVKDRIHQTFLEYAHPEPNSGCWLWAGALGNKYGRISKGRRGRYVYAHRYSYEVHHGPIPDGLHVLHACDNPACVNPDHLHVGTHQDNMREARERERFSRAPTIYGVDHHRAKLSPEDVREIRCMRASGATLPALAKLYGVRPSTIDRIAKRQTWKSVA